MRNIPNLIISASVALGLGAILGCAELSEFMRPILQGPQGRMNQGQTTVPQSSRSPRLQHMDSSLSVDAYNEEAFVEYRDKLRDGLQFLSLSANPQIAQNFTFALNTFRTEMALLIGDIQRWPQDRRVEAWRVMGPEIKQLTELFDEERGRIVDSVQYAESFRTTLSEVPLLRPEMI